MNGDKTKLNLYLFLFTSLLFISSVILALSLSEEFIEENIRIFENPEAVENSLYYFLLILLFTALILFIIKTKKLRALQYFILFLIFYSFLVTLTSLIPFLPSFIISSFLVILLRFYPEWWVIDLSGVLLSGIAIALLGISLGILPTVILLLILSIYDFISVYKTGHMVSMAKSILELRLPILFVIPTSKNYSFLRGERKGAVFLGLGDVVIPSILAISSNYYFNAPKILSLNIVALFTIIGILIGFFALFFLTSREKAHPGLPFLNGGALVGFLFGLLLT